ncbi:MAG: bifunctional [glutamate--ammonia ligase]-adenylyl-L-tyrosine phosphorylase/[glutamate--ammonia-ligase] adenylyltransferase [Candidatus Contendobacter odensis]|uniref:Bifunctional glutamine synthetase adenylyltransferase/adenylyl-removing enzyme n=1 Tax=Candidatus Contendibacter odensensis TaxID=1400860 RepID=A0A2G6PDU9_9GAMM|nr:MAG: bifunctional [glutamate--ammonia ligase]-adenylyl-L-tyrosine phosphorylase/[glutamate--ammonia-ligase] adenylyltransferase [Candidatus Contendobacter odensis]
MKDVAEKLQQLPKALQNTVARYWEAYETAAQAAGVTPPTGTRLGQLLLVWACSEFVARSCIREPKLLTDLLNSGDLATRYTTGDCATRLERLISNITDTQQLGVALRRFRRREMLRIAWRDLAHLAELEETLGDLSDLADATVDAALHHLHQKLSQRHGQPLDHHGQPQRLVVLGMGKLGGRELNFSSDIDLIFTYPGNGKTDGRRVVSNEEFFRRLGQRLSKLLAEPTAEGFVFRVDLRLRPFGDSGPVAISFSAFEDYCQNHGRDWERYAMIKARVIAGDPDAGAQLLETLRPFVYRRYLDYSAFEALRSMKMMIAQEIERKGIQGNVKLGHGGIREIEFIGQAFQLIYGGREPALRERSILRVLDYLAESDRLPHTAVNDLKTAYDFLRRVENRLQAWADQQTHILPDDEQAQLRLAFSMGYPDWQTFAIALGQHTERVAQQFAQIFGSAEDTETASESEPLGLAALWPENLAEEKALALLAEYGFETPTIVLNRLHALANGFSYRTMSQRGRERLDSLIPQVLDAVTTVPQPTIVLERIFDLLEAIARRSVYIALLAEHPHVLAQLVKLCTDSAWIARHLSRYPLLLDDLLSPAILHAPLNHEQLVRELDRQIARIPENDPEELLNALRYFKQSQVLRVAAADISNAIPLMVVSDYLTEIAETLLLKVLERAWIDIEPKFGIPECIIDDVKRKAQFAIIAYGKLGGIELNYGSDLDLVFLHDSSGSQQITNGPRQIDNASFFAKLVQRIIHYLTTRTGAGGLYEVDTRLRPSGRAGLLVTSFEAFAEYQQKQAWTWEHQALVRARVVAGPSTLIHRFQAIRRNILECERDPDSLRQEVRDMRERMRTELDSSDSDTFDLKQGRGGIADIEFMVQYEILAHACRYPELLTFTDNIRQLDGLEQTGILSTADAAQLRDAYREQRRHIHLLTLQEQPARIPLDNMQVARESVNSIWQRLMENG